MCQFYRIRKGAPGYIVMLNLSPDSKEVNFEGVKGVPSEAHVILRSSKAGEKTPTKGYYFVTLNVEIKF